MRAKLLASLWVVLLLIGALTVVVSPIKLESDPLALLDGNSQQAQGVQKMRALLGSQAREILIILDSKSEDITDENQQIFLAAKRIQAGLVAAGLAEDFSVHNSPVTDAESKLILLAPDLRGQLLNTAQLSTLSAPDAVARLKLQILSKLTSPLGSYYRTWLATDPLLLMPEFLINSPARLAKQFQSDGVVRVRLKPDPSLGINQEAIISGINGVIQTVQHDFPLLNIQWIGFVRFAHDSATRLSSELKIVSIVSTLLIILTTFLSFGSLWPILLSLLSGATGILMATAMATLFYPGIHFFTLTIGAVLSGVTVDYSLLFFAHYYAGRKSGAQIMRRISVSIWVGAATSALAFAALAFSGLAGLEQIAFFCVTSLIASFLTVLLLFPFLLAREGPEISTIGQRASTYALSSIQRTFARPMGIMLSALALMLLMSQIIYLHSNNDIRSFQAASPELLEVQRTITKKIAPEFSGTLLQFKTISDINYDRALLLLRNLHERGAIETLPSWLILPQSAKRMESLLVYSNFIARNKDDLRAMLMDLGIKDEIIDAGLTAKQQIIPINDIFQSLMPLVGDAAEEANQSIVLPLAGILNLEEVKAAFATGITTGFSEISVLNYASVISELFQAQMKNSIVTVSLAYLFIILCFFVRYGRRLALLAAVQVLGVGGATLGVLSLCSVTVDFFSVLALVVVLGLCVDYGVFFLEDSEYFSASATAIVTSTVATVGAFGLLAMSSSPVLAGFGTTIALGVTFSMLLAPLVAAAGRVSR